MRRRGKETSICGCLSCGPYREPGLHATQAPALTGNRTKGPLVRRPALNPLSHTSQGQYIVLVCLKLVVDRLIVNFTHIPLAVLEAMVASPELLQVSDSGARAGGAAATWSTFFFVRGQKH